MNFMDSAKRNILIDFVHIEIKSTLKVPENQTKKTYIYDNRFQTIMLITTTDVTQKLLTCGENTHVNRIKFTIL